MDTLLIWLGWILSYLNGPLAWFYDGWDAFELKTEPAQDWLEELLIRYGEWLEPNVVRYGELLADLLSRWL